MGLAHASKLFRIFLLSRYLGKLRLESTKHDLASVKQNRHFVKFGLFAKVGGKQTNQIHCISPLVTKAFLYALDTTHL
uniref:Uncharacterized protein n=1 Tax=Candidatus Kentrum sp. LFY TaxID=2126342 RepID=A0A450WFM4_9GAMM|nr:MAG: hypothetical protein BECKLFY1418C_GA0070996_10187 [Candidatus Kentron sp. LFY]